MRHRLFRDPGLSYVLAAAYTLVGWSYFADRGVTSRSVVGRAVAPYDACWNTLYLIAGALMLLRLLQGGSNWERGALVALAGGWTINATVAVAVQGASDVRSYALFAFVFGALLRLRVLLGGGSA